MNTEAEALRAELARWRDSFQAGSRAWSLAHHVTAFGAAIISVAVGFIIQRPESWTLAGLSRDSLSTVLALLAAVLATIAATGGFERKWHSNRLSRSKIDLLRLDLLDPTPDFQTIRSELKLIIAAHDRAIIGLLRDSDDHGRPKLIEPERGSPQGPARPLSGSTA
jgi:hypothetical protein